MIQIDMPMPTNCLICPACDEYLMCAIPINGRKWGENDVSDFSQCRPEWCPLKEQETKQAIKQIYHVMINRDYENPVEVTRYDWLCPTCKSLLCRDIDVIDDNYRFCKVCGQAVKWE